MKRVAVIAAVLAIAACKGKEAPSMESIAKPVGAAAAAADTTMKKADTMMMKADTMMKKADTAMKKMAAPPPPAKKP